MQGDQGLGAGMGMGMGVLGVGQLGEMPDGGGGGPGASGAGISAVVDHQHRQMKAEVVAHPMYEQLLAAHVGCLRVATPIDHLPLIDAQLAQAPHLLRSYQSQSQPHLLSLHDKQELDHFLVCTNQ